MTDLICDLDGRGVIVTAAGGSIGSACTKAVVYFMAADWETGEVTDVNGGYFID